MAIADFGAGVQAVLRQRMLDDLERRQIEAQMASQEAAGRRADRGLELDERSLGLREAQFDAELNAPAAPEKPISVGGRLVMPSGQVVYEPPPEPEKPINPVMLSPGSRLIDPTTGRLIASSPTAGPAPKAVNKMWVIRDGKPVFVAEDAVLPGDLPGNTREQGRPSLGAEKNALNFFNRMVEAERNARAVEGKITGRDVLASEYAPGWLENFLKTPEGQQYTQAQRTFTEARLRKESGAAIPQGEFDTDRKTNFRSPGDTPDVLKKKRESRLTTMRGIGQTAGRALQEHYGEDATLDSLLAEFAEKEAAGGGGALAPGTKRVINGTPAVWDGKGWLPE